MEQLSFLVPTDMFKAGDLVAITKLGEADVEPVEGSLMFPIELGACLLIARGDDRIFRSSQVQAVAVETAGETFDLARGLIVQTLNSIYALRLKDGV